MNYPIARYAELLEVLPKIPFQELLASLRRRSLGFRLGVAPYRGVTAQAQSGQWEARISVPRCHCNPSSLKNESGRAQKTRYLGTFLTQEEAARAYDREAVRLRGANAMTNFPMAAYSRELNEHDSSRREELSG